MTTTRKNTKRVILKKILASKLLFDIRHWVKISKEEDKEESRVQLEETIGKKLYKLLEELGPSYIKLGQILSTRYDILPHPIIEELEKLQDDVAPLPFQDMRGQIEREIGRDLADVFQSLEVTPIASASIAQVYIATLKDNQERVCLKVRRPGVKEIIQADIQVMRDLAGTLDRFFSFSQIIDYEGMLAEFHRQLLDELDFRKEAKNLIKFQEMIKRDKYVHTPRLLLDYSGEELLTMEYFDAPSLRHIVKTYKRKDRADIAKRLLYSYANQVFRDGFFHGDPHPGNILINSTEDIVFLDFGIMGSLSVKDKYAILLLFLGITKDSPRVILDALGQLDLLNPDADNTRLEDDIQRILDHYLTLTLKEIDLQVMINDFFSLLYKYQIRLPGSLTMFFKALVILEGVISSLDLDQNILEMAQPIARKLLRNFISRDYFTSSIFPALYDSGVVARDFPSWAADFGRILQRRDFRFGLSQQASPEETKRQNARAKMGSLTALLVANSFFFIILFFMQRLLPVIAQSLLVKIFLWISAILELVMLYQYRKLWKQLD